MTGTRQILLVARRDFTQRAKSKAFLATMILIVGLILVGGPLIANLAEPDPVRSVGLVGGLPSGTSAAVATSGTALDLEVGTESYESLEAAEQALHEGDVDALLVSQDPTPSIVWEQDADPPLELALQQAVVALGQQETASELDLTAAEQQQLLAPEPPQTRSLEPTDETVAVQQGVSFAAMLLLYLSVVIFGQFVMLGVMEEKASRVVEVLLSRVRAYQLLAGKVLGIGALALLQIIVLAGALYFLADRVLLDGGAAGAGIGVGLIVPLVGWFLLGFVFFAVLYAGLGATVTRQEDAQSVGLLPIALILPAYFIGIIAANDAETVVVRVASLIPPFSPFVMPVRAANVEVPGWEVLVAALLLVVATYGMIRLAGRIYTGAILSVGQRVSLRQAWRAADRPQAQR